MHVIYILFINSTIWANSCVTLYHLVIFLYFRSIYYYEQINFSYNSLKETTRLYNGSKKNRSAMRTCVAYEIELLFSVWCLIGFLSEELMPDYH